MTGAYLDLGTLRGYMVIEDGAYPVLDRFERKLVSSEKAWGQFETKLSHGASAFLPISVGLGALGISAVKAATDTNRALANVSALLTDISGPELDRVVGDMKGKVRALSVDMGKSTTDIASGLYEVISSLGYTKDTFAQLEISAKAGAAGLATTQESFNFLTSVTKTYGDTSEAAFKKAANLGFQAVNFGQTTFPQLAASIGSVAPIAKVAGVSMEEMFAVIATATGVTGNTAEVTTQMASALNALLNPSKEMAQLFETVGVKTGEALIQERGFVGALQAVSDYAAATETPMLQLLGRKEAFILTASLAGAQAQKFGQNLGEMGKAGQANADILDAAFEKQTQGINATGFAWEQFMAKVRVRLEEFGDAIVPMLGRVLKAMDPLLDMAKDAIRLFTELPGPVQTFAIALGMVGIAASPVLYFLSGFVRVGGFAMETVIGLGRWMGVFATAEKAAAAATLELTAAQKTAIEFEALFTLQTEAAAAATAKKVGIFATLGGWLTKAGTWFKDSGVRIAAAVAPFLSWQTVITIGTRVLGALATAFEFVTGPVGLAVGAIVLATAATWKLIGGWDGLKGIARTLWDAIQAGWQTLKDIGTILGWLTETMLEPFIGMLRTGAQAVLDFHAPLFEAFGELKTLAADAWGSVTKSMSSAVGTIKGLISEFIAFHQPLFDALKWVHDTADSIRLHRTADAARKAGFSDELPPLPLPPPAFIPRMGPQESKPVDVDALLGLSKSMNPPSLPASLSAQLEKTRALVAALTEAERDNIRAGDVLGLSAEAIAEHMRKPQTVVQMFLDQMRAARTITHDFAYAMGQLAADVGDGYNTLNDQDFFDEFSTKLRNAERDFEKLGKTGADVPWEIRIGLERLNGIRADEWARSLREDITSVSNKFTTLIEDIDRTALTFMELPDTMETWTSSPDYAAWQKTADFARLTYERIKHDGTSTAEEISRAWEEWFERDYRNRFAWAAGWTSSLQTLAAGFTQLSQIAGSSLSAVVRDIGTFIAAMQLGAESVKGLGRGIALWKDATTTSGKLGAAAQIGSSAMGIYAGLQQSTASGDSGAKIAKGAAFGAQQGLMVGLMVGKNFGPYGAAIGAAAGAIYGFVRSRMVTENEKEARAAYKSWEDATLQRLTSAQAGEAAGRRWAATNIIVRDSYLDIGRSEEEALRDIAMALDATHYSAEEVANAVARINQNLAEADVDKERLAQAIEKYGFTLDELGRETVMDRMNAQALDLIENWRVLVQSGIQVSTVNRRMGADISGYLNNAIALGQDVPIAFQPILEQMVKSGDLLDANGIAFRNLEDANITWARTLGQEFDRVIEKLEVLFAKVFGITDAVAGIPRTVNVDYVETGSEASPTGPAAPPRVDPVTGAPLPVPMPTNGYSPREVPGFRGGTNGEYVDFGRGTLAVLHGRERVMTEAEAEAPRGDTYISITVPINTWSSAGFDETVREKVAPIVIDAVLRANVKSTGDDIRRSTR